MKFIKFPLFMRRKKKVQVLNAMLKKLNEKDKIKNCTECGIKFEKWMSRWSKADFDSCICILCHRRFWNQTDKDYCIDEIKELKKIRKITK